MADSSHYSWAKLVNGDSVETSPDQFLIWSETGKRLELWGPRQSGGLLLLASKIYPVAWGH